MAVLLNLTLILLLITLDIRIWWKAAEHVNAFWMQMSISWSFLIQDTPKFTQSSMASFIDLWTTGVYIFITIKRFS